MTKKFKELGLSDSLLEVLKERGFDKPTEIQEKSIPFVLKGKDVIAGASTGSGKTLAFAVCLLKNSKKDYGIQGLVLTPTRELAEQITTELKKFSKNDKKNIASVYGGVSFIRQEKSFESAEIIVGTPGRILDHLSKGTLDLSRVNTLVLDEADRMLDMGFIDDVKKIIEKCPKERQTLLYSATIGNEIVELAKDYMRNPIEISAETYVDPTKLSQIYYDVPDGLKYSLLNHLLKKEKSKLVMVFCNTRNNVDFVVNNLKISGINAIPIHGGFSQDKRLKILNEFHSKKSKILICTDVAARGLDIKEVSHIYNYDIPRESNEYVHRIGRTARAGEIGKVINLVSSRDYDNFNKVLRDNPEIKIFNEKTPYIKKIKIKWKKEKRGNYNKFNKQRNNKIKWKESKYSNKKRFKSFNKS